VFYPLEIDRLKQDCEVLEQFSERYDTRYVNMGLSITEYDVQEESKVLDTLEDLPNFSMYVTESTKKNIDYGFWSRSTIPWSLDCEVEHPREKVINAANFEKEKEPLNETAVIVLSAIAYGAGFLATLVVTGCLFVGKCKKKCFGEVQAKGATGLCLGIQLILFIVTVILVFGQKTELAERDEAMRQLTFVNDCGDKFTQIPDYFLPEIDDAKGKMLYVVIATIVQVILVFIALIACVLGKPSDDDDEDYDKLPHDEEEE